MKLKVLHVINSLLPGGAEMLLVNSLSQGGLQQHTDNIVVYFYGSSPIAGLIDKNVKVINLEYKGIWHLPFVLKKLKKIILKQKVDIVHSHLNPAGFYTRLALPANVPQVHTMHTTYSMNKETPPCKLFLEKYLLLKRKNANLVFLSDFTRDDFLQHESFAGNYFVLNNFVADTYFKTEPKVYTAQRKDLRLIAIGRLNKIKNFEYLLQVFSFLKEQPVYLDIYGAGDIEGFENKIVQAGLNVTMKGYHENLAAIIDQYDLFIMPSTMEGFPLSVFEAMASGVPVMVSNIAPLKSIAGEHALYFNLDNAEQTAEQIKAVLQRIIDVNAQAQKAKAYAQNTVKREVYINRLLQIYNQVLSRNLRAQDS